MHYKIYEMCKLYKQPALNYVDFLHSKSMALKMHLLDYEFGTAVFLQFLHKFVQSPKITV